MNALPSVGELRKALAVYAVPDTRQGVLLFAVDMVPYLAALAAALFAPWPWVQVVASVLAGFKMTNLTALGHDAAHNSLTASRRLNKLLAIVTLMPGLFNYELWVYDHHIAHHASTNGKHPDAFTPLSKKEYDALSVWGKLRERLVRAPMPLVFGPYYLARRWWGAKFFPRKYMPADVQRAAWPYFWGVLSYMMGYSALLTLGAPLVSEHTTPLRALVLCLVVPVLVFYTLFGFSTYLMHTNPRVPWFLGRPDLTGDGRQELVTVHARFPQWMSHLLHHVFHHSAHHVHPAIPCYRLPEAQAKLNELLGPYAVSMKVTVFSFFDIQRRCKLYDYENHRWTDFEGRPTTEVLVYSARQPPRPEETARPSSAA